MVITLFIAAVTLASPGSASFSQTQDQPAQLTLDSAVNTALLMSTQARRAEINLEEQLVTAIALEEQHRAGAPLEQCFPVGVDQMTGMPIERCLGPSDYEAAQIEELLPEQVEAIRGAAAAAYRQQMAALQSQVIESYYNAVLAQGAVELHATHLERMARHEANARRALEQGTIAELDLAQAEAGLAQAQAEAFAAEEQAQLALLNLKELIGLPLDRQTSLASGVADWTPSHWDYDEDLAKALENSAQVQAAKGQLAVAEKDLELFRKNTGGFRGRVTFRQRELAVAQALVNLEEAQRRTETQVRGIHSQLAQAALRVDAARRQAELARRVADLAHLRYEVGLATTVDVLEAEGTLLQAELGRLQALIGAHTAEAQRRVLVGETPPQVARRLENISRQVGELR